MTALSWICLYLAAGGVWFWFRWTDIEETRREVNTPYGKSLFIGLCIGVVLWPLVAVLWLFMSSANWAAERFPRFPRERH